MWEQLQSTEQLIVAAVAVAVFWASAGVFNWAGLKLKIDSGHWIGGVLMFVIAPLIAMAAANFVMRMF